MDAMMTGAQILGSSPQLGQAYNLGPMFSYLWKTQNVDFTPFEKSQEQQAYEQALGAWNNIMMTAAEKGIKIDQPQPLPEQYGYVPAQNNPGAKAPQANVENASRPGTQGPAQ